MASDFALAVGCIVAALPVARLVSTILAAITMAFLLAFGALARVRTVAVGFVEPLAFLCALVACFAAGFFFYFKWLLA